MYLCLARMSFSYSLEGQSSAILAADGPSRFTETRSASSIACRTCSFEDPGRILRWTYPRKWWAVRRSRTASIISSIVSFSSLPIPELRKSPSILFS